MLEPRLASEVLDIVLPPRSDVIPDAENDSGEREFEPNPCRTITRIVEQERDPVYADDALELCHLHAPMRAVEICTCAVRRRRETSSRQDVELVGRERRLP